MSLYSIDVQGLHITILHIYIYAMYICTLCIYIYLYVFTYQVCYAHLPATSFSNVFF